MKSLLNPADKAALLVRLRSISPASRGRWGKMSAHQMVCHLGDGYRLYMGLVDARPVAVPYPRVLLKRTALWAPIPWPHGFKTAPELDQEAGGTRPAVFNEDVRALQSLIDRFTGEPRDFQCPQSHPHFGKMTTTDWMRLAYLHTNHHLRQFGA